MCRCNASIMSLGYVLLTLYRSWVGGGRTKSMLSFTFRLPAFYFVNCSKIKNCCKKQFAADVWWEDSRSGESRAQLRPARWTGPRDNVRNKRGPIQSPGSTTTLPLALSVVCARGAFLACFILLFLWSPWLPRCPGLFGGLICFNGKQTH